MHIEFARAGRDGKDLEQKLEHHMYRLLTVVEAGGARGVRLIEEGKRLCKRVRQFVHMKLAENSLDEDALELACFALQLPSKNIKLLTPGKMGQVSLKDRCEQAAELLISTAGDDVEAELLERATTILRAMPHRNTKMDEARLKDGFHFEPVRKMARERLKYATQVVDLLLGELKEDQGL